MAALRKFKIACIQMAVGANKAANVQRAVERVQSAASQGAQLVVLPECFNSPYGTQYFAEYAESVPGETTEALGKVAKEQNVILIGGSIPERCDGKLYNTLTVFGRTGDLLGKYRKMHLFDIDVPGKIRFIESDILTAGDSPAVIDCGLCKIGLGICYDCRFPELSSGYRTFGCDLLVYPGAFNMTTGPAHWELLARSTALSNQVFTAFCSPARDTHATYVAWGHSLVAGPWGDVLASCEDSEQIIFADIDLQKCAEVREWVPISKQKRPIQEKSQPDVIDAN